MRQSRGKPNNPVSIDSLYNPLYIIAGRFTSSLLFRLSYGSFATNDGIQDLSVFLPFIFFPSPTLDLPSKGPDFLLPLVMDGKIFRKRWLGEAASLIFLCRKGNDVSARFLPVNAFIRSFRITMHPGPFLSGWKKDMRNHPLRSRGTGARERNDGGEVGDEWLFIAIENISVSGLAADKCDWSRLDRPLSVHRCAKGGV